MIHVYISLRNGRFVAVFAGVFISIFVLPSCVGLSSNSDNSIGVPIDESAADSNDLATDGHGPTMIMSYEKGKFVKNPIASFMYFIPLIAPTPVDNISSVNNDQQVGIISYELKESSRFFKVTCGFEILGTGFHMNTFDAAGMIAAHTDELKKGQTLTNMLDYIRFDGQGYGVIEVKGTITDSVRIVTEVSMQFTAGGHKSPVTIGLYDIKPTDGKYQYENRTNEVFARVNTLAFTRTEQTPRMEIKVASISKSEKPEGFWSHVKGMIANLLITPPKVNKFGNTTMLEFGDALLQKKPTFTFPMAKNIKESKIVEIDPNQN